jgi:hypothetical protein
MPQFQALVAAAHQLFPSQLQHRVAAFDDAK